jgi:hypothetical protein
MDMEINFTDETMASCNGDFETVKNIMDLEEVGKTKWTIRTDVSINSDFGLGNMSLSCSYNKKVIIYEYDGLNNNITYNPEIIAIVTWAQEKGWDRPMVENDLARVNKHFWKHFYDSYIIDCELFEKIYKERE